MSKKKAFLLGFCLTLAVLVPVYLAVCAYSLSRTAPVEQKQQGVPVIQPLSTDARTLALMTGEDGPQTFVLIRFDAYEGHITTAALDAQTVVPVSYTHLFNPALDYVVRLPKLRQGEVNRTQSEEIQFGGKGINVSCVLGELGAASTALGFIAGFTGDALQQGLCAMGLHTDFVRLAQGATRINVKLKAQRETDINAAGPAVDKACLLYTSRCV